MAQRIRIIIAFLLFFAFPAQAGLVERYFDYGPTSTVTDVNLDGNINNILNEINGGLDGDNVDTGNGWRLIEILSSAPAAGNQGRVVFLTSNNTLNFDTGSSFITTAVLPNNQTFSGNNTFNGTSTFGGTVTANSSFSANGTTNTIGNGGSDTLTLNVPGGMTLSAATTWTLTGALTFSGTIADLGTVTTADINGGTIAIGGTTATGELIVNNASDDADGLGSQGVIGQFLQSAGTGANPTFVGAVKLLSATAIAGTNSGDIVLGTNKLYLVVFEMTTTGTAAEIGLRFESDATGTSYAWGSSYVQFNTTPGATDVGDNSDSEISLTAALNANNTKNISGSFYIDTTNKGADGAFVWGETLFFDDTAGFYTRNGFGGVYLVDASVNDFEIFSTMTLTGDIYVYEFGLI